ncbi:hypothetical protein PC121_g3624 [Phytophthora cactorum]|nr:hypothetical protein PC121_g3624 [Phytophthora cactorum]
MDPDPMTIAVSGESDGPSCAACERATCAGPEPDPQDILDVVEHGFPRPDEQWLSRYDVVEHDLPHAVDHEFPHVVERELPANEDETVVERGLRQAVETALPRVVEQELPGTTAVVEHGLPLAVEHGLPHVVERELPEVVDAVESSIPHPEADPFGRCHESTDMIERGFSSSAAESAPRPVRRRGRRTPRRSRILSACSTSTEPEVISVLVGDGDDSVAHVREVEVARPPCDAASITQLPGLSWKHFLRDLKRGEIEQVCMIVPVADDTVAAVEPSRCRRSRRPVTPVAPLVREFIEIFPEKVPAVLPPDRGIRHDIDLTPGAKYCITRQWPFPRDQTEAIDAFFESHRRAGHVRESVSPHSSPTFCVKKATGGWRTVHAFNKLNDATIPAQTPIPRKDMALDTMFGSTQYSAIDLMNGFYQILIREDDVPLTAVSTPSGMLWEWLVMPQGLKNAPATFNRMVSNLLRPFRSFAPSYFDDIFIHSRAEV